MLSVRCRTHRPPLRRNGLRLRKDISMCSSAQSSAAAKRIKHLCVKDQMESANWSANQSGLISWQYEQVRKGNKNESLRKPQIDRHFDAADCRTCRLRQTRARRDCRQEDRPDSGSCREEDRTDSGGRRARRSCAVFGCSGAGRQSDRRRVQSREAWPAGF